MPLPFEKQPRESEKAFAAFSLYLSQGPERSIEECARKFLKSSRLLRRWAKQFDWPARVAAHSAHLAIVEAGEAAIGLEFVAGFDFSKHREVTHRRLLIRDDLD